MTEAKIENDLTFSESFMNHSNIELDWKFTLSLTPYLSMISIFLFNSLPYADDTTAYASHTDISALELSLNKDLENLSSWFPSNYLSVNRKKTQAMILGKHSHEPALHIDDSVIEIGFLNIPGVCVGDELSFKDHLSTVLRTVYAKVGVPRKLKKLMPADISLMLYKAYILPHLKCCGLLLLEINPFAPEPPVNARSPFGGNTPKNTVR